MSENKKRPKAPSIAGSLGDRSERKQSRAGNGRAMHLLLTVTSLVLIGVIVFTVPGAVTAAHDAKDHGFPGGGASISLIALVSLPFVCFGAMWASWSFHKRHKDGIALTVLLFPLINVLMFAFGYLISGPQLY